jgi:hypothetical protein
MMRGDPYSERRVAARRRLRRLEDTAVQQLRQARAAGERPYSLGRALGLSNGSIRQILEGETYKDVS